MGQSNDAEKGLGYSPLPKVNNTKIKDSWSVYKEAVGLEGDYFSRLIKEGKSVDEAKELSKIHFESEESQENRKTWEELRKEEK